MKLLVRKLWFPHSVDDTVAALFNVRQIRELFEGYTYEGEMRPRGIKICAGYWPADKIMKRIPTPGKDIGLVFTSLDLKGDPGRVHGKGGNRVAIASNHSFKNTYSYFDPESIDFNAVIFHEVGHGLGLGHHSLNPSSPCEMAHNIDGPKWSSLDDIRFCNDCYRKIE